MPRQVGSPVVVEGSIVPRGDGAALPEPWTRSCRKGPRGGLKREPRVDESDLYVLFRERGAGRYPFLLAWLNRHGLTSGYEVQHAARFGRVLVVGQPDGLSLPETCDTSYVNAETADVLFRGLPSVRSFFGRGHGE